MTQHIAWEHFVGKSDKMLPSLANRPDMSAKSTQIRQRKIPERKKVKPIKTVSLTFDAPDLDKENGVSEVNGRKVGQGQREASKTEVQMLGHSNGNPRLPSLEDMEHINDRSIDVAPINDISHRQSHSVLPTDKLNEEFQRFLAKETSDSQSDTNTNRSSQNAPPANITINLYLNNEGATGALSPHSKVTSSNVQISRTNDVVSIKQSQEVKDNATNDATDNGVNGHNREFQARNEPDILVLDHEDIVEDLAIELDDGDNSEIEDCYEGMPQVPSPGKRHRSSNWSQYGESITDDVVAEFHSLSQDALSKKEIKRQELRHRMSSLPAVSEAPDAGQLFKVEQWLNQMHNDESLNGASYVGEDDECNNSQNGYHYPDSLVDSVFGDHVLEPQNQHARLEHHYSYPEPPSYEAPKHRAEIFRRSCAKDPHQLVMMNRTACESTNPDLLSKPPTPHAWLAAPQTAKNNKALPPISQEVKVPYSQNVEEHVSKQTKNNSLGPLNGENGHHGNHDLEGAASGVGSGFQGYGYTMQGQPHWKRATIVTHMDMSALQGDLNKLSESMPHMPHPPNVPAIPHPPLPLASGSNPSAPFSQIPPSLYSASTKDAATQYDPSDRTPIAMETDKAGGQSIDVQPSADRPGAGQVNPCAENDSGFWSADENNLWEDHNVYVAYLQTESGALIGPLKLELDSLHLGLPGKSLNRTNNGSDGSLLTDQEKHHCENDIANDIANDIDIPGGKGLNEMRSVQRDDQVYHNSASQNGAQNSNAKQSHISEDDESGTNEFDSAINSKSEHSVNGSDTEIELEKSIIDNSQAESNGPDQKGLNGFPKSLSNDHMKQTNNSDMNRGALNDSKIPNKLSKNNVHGAVGNDKPSGRLNHQSLPGLRNRQTGSNSVNEHSSRSHSMLTLQIDSETQDPDDENLYITKHGKLTFVDLAGSEKVKNETSATAGHLLESNNINKSLLVLGNCIAALGDAKRKTGHIPYRDSKLTKLLADSLGGNGVTLMIACVSPSACNSFESLNTLRYANRAKKIKTKPVVKMDPREKLILSLKREIKVLRQENHYLRQQLEFPVKPKGQLQKENDEKFLRMLKDQQDTGTATVTDHGLYEMLQEYMIENETLRNENSDLHQIKDQSKRDQQILARENEKLIRRVDDMERGIHYSATPVSIYSVNSSRHGSATDHGNFYNRPSQGPGPPWGHPPEQLSRNSTSDSWASYKQRPPGYEVQNGQSNGYPPPGGSRRTTPPAGIPQRKKPPHRLAEPIKSPRYEGGPPPPGPPGGGYAARYQQMPSPRDGYTSPRGGIPGPGPGPRGPSNQYPGQSGPPRGYPGPQQHPQYSQPPPQQRMPNPHPGQPHPGQPPQHAQHPRQPDAPPIPQQRRSKGSQGSSHSSVSIPSDHGSATLSTSGSVAESTQEMNERLKRELMDLEGEIHSNTKHIQQPRKAGPR